MDPFWIFESPGELVPYSALFVSVRAITYWGASSSDLVLLHSPPSIPSQPTNPRVFVSYIRKPGEENQVSLMLLSPFRKIKCSHIRRHTLKLRIAI